MGNLKTFLKEQAEKRSSLHADADAVRKDWVESCNRLIGQMAGWLEDADPSHVLLVEHEDEVIREEKLGKYKVDSLSITLGSREVRVRPVSRFVVGPFLKSGAFAGRRADGLVEMTDGGLKYRLYRFKEESGERWVMIDDETYRPVDYDRSAFEGAIQRLLE